MCETPWCLSGVSNSNANKGQVSNTLMSEEDGVQYKERGSVVIGRVQTPPQGVAAAQLCGWAWILIRTVLPDVTIFLREATNLDFWSILHWLLRLGSSLKK